MENLLLHVEAARKVLESMRTSRCYGEASVGQASRLEADILRTNLLPTDAARLLDAIGKVPWSSEEDLERLHTAISTASTSQQASRNTFRVPNQNYETLFRYYTAAHWNASQEFSEEARFAFVKLAVALGMRNPTEKSVQVLTAIVLIIELGIDKAKQLSPNMLNDRLKHIKKVVKQIGKIRPSEYIETLPASPSLFQERHPQMYAAAYGDEMPTTCPIHCSDIEAVARTIPLRVRPGSAAMPAQTGTPDAMAAMMQQLLSGFMRQHGQNLRFAGVEPRIDFFEPRRAIGDHLGSLQLGGGFRRSHSGPALADGVSPYRQPNRLPVVGEHPLQGHGQIYSQHQEQNEQQEQTPPPTRARTNGPADSLHIDETEMQGQPTPQKRQRKSVEEAMQVVMSASQDKADAKAAEKAVEKADAKKKVKPKATAVAKAVAKAMKAGPTTDAKAPCFAHEASRSQFLVRTGRARPGNNTVFKYKGEVDKMAVKRKALALYKNECTSQGLVPRDY
jgi:hypothetical protein